MIFPPRPAVRFTTSASFSDDVLDLLVEAVAVSAFHDEVVGWIQLLRVADDGEPGTADVARESQAHAIGFQHHRGRPQHVPGVKCLVAEAVRDLLLFP